MAENTEQVKINSKKNTNFIYAIGRRKQASARARLYQEIKSSYDFKKGDIFVNGKKASEYFKGELARLNYIQPLQIVDAVSKYAFTIKVQGGGENSQLDAVILAMSKALAKLDDKNKVLLRKKGLLTTDARVKERRKVGTGGKARRKKQSPKR
ncbi:MAG: 30S ribosomal protein S9 [Patescibacteria group bacterium]